MSVELIYGKGNIRVIEKVNIVGEFVVTFLGKGGHLPAQAHIQSESGADLPVVLEVKPRQPFLPARTPGQPGR